MKKKNLIVGILEKKLTDSKDWTGNKASVYKTLAASNHSSSEREKNDFYATDPKAIDLLLEKENFSDLIWEPACGQGHLSKRLEQKRQIRLNEIANDSYYLSNQRKEDEQELNALERRLRELKEQEDEPSLLDLCKELKEMAQ